MTYLAEIKNLTVEYEGQRTRTLAIDNVNLDINYSDFVVVLGPSGCGKTTLLNVLAGFVKPTSGQVLVKSQPVKGPGSDRGVIFQETNLYPWLNIEDNIMFGPRLKNKSMADYKDKFDHYIQLIGLEDFKKHYPYELSGGMQQRVAIARTMINKPDLLLMDEPFAALDAINRSHLQNFIREFWKDEKLTVFMITHDIDEALTLANRVFVMAKNPGRIVKEYKVDFNEKILEDSSYMPHLDSKFLQIKKEIIDILAENKK